MNGHSRKISRRQMLQLAAGGAAALGIAGLTGLSMLGMRDESGSTDTEGGPYASRALKSLPPGAIRARGWLREQLARQAAGLTGHAGELFPDIGPRSGWLGGDGESWERGPYYVRGLVALAYALDDAALKADAQRWIDWTLDSQRDDGSFGPEALPPLDWWPRMPMLFALKDYHAATGDARVIRFMLNYLAFQDRHIDAHPLDGWAYARGGDNAYIALWVYDETGEPWLLKLADKVNAQTLDWASVHRNHSFGRDGDYWSWHAVNVAEGLRQPGMLYARTGDTAYIDAIKEGLRFLSAEHGQPQGVFSGDERLAGTDPVRGTETCTVVEALLSYQILLDITGDPAFADLMESAAYNALPALFKPDLKAHQYFQQPNQVRCAIDDYGWDTKHQSRDDNLFGIGVGFGCCISNLHMGWPRFASNLWKATRDGGIAAMGYAPAEISAELGGQPVRVEVGGDYPFRGEIAITVRTPEPAAFPMRLRVPAWTRGAEITVGGETTAAAPGLFIELDRRWQDGDTVTLRLPMRVETQNRHRNAISVSRGPLVYALSAEETWQPVSRDMPTPGTTIPTTYDEQAAHGFPTYEVHAASDWNAALIVNADDPAGSFESVAANAVADQPWARENAPVSLRARAVRLADWGMAGSVHETMPVSPVEGGDPFDVTLIPYGCARIRLSVIPWTEEKT